MFLLEKQISLSDQNSPTSFISSQRLRCACRQFGAGVQRVVEFGSYDMERWPSWAVTVLFLSYALLEIAVRNYILLGNADRIVLHLEMLYEFHFVEKRCTSYCIRKRCMSYILLRKAPRIILHLGMLYELYSIVKRCQTCCTTGSCMSYFLLSKAVYISCMSYQLCMWTLPKYWYAKECLSYIVVLDAQ